MKNKRAFVICCNDAVEHVVIDDEALAYKTLKDYSDNDEGKKYNPIMYWHIHEVAYIKPKGFWSNLFSNLVYLISYNPDQASIGSLK